MATKDFLLPDLGEGLTEGEVVSWLVRVGDVVEVDQYVAEIETAKAVVEVPSPFAGTIAVLHGEPGDEVAVGAPLITIDVGGEPDAAVPTAAPATTPAPTAEDEGSGNVLVGYGTSAGGGSRRRRVGAEDAVPPPGDPTAVGGAAPAASEPLDAPATDGPSPLSARSGPDSSADEDGRDPSPSGRPAAGPPIRADGRPMAKPPVRRLAKEHGIDLHAIAGSGPDGIITREDVQAAIATPPSPSASVPAEAAAPVPAEAAAPATAGQQRVPLGQMRKAISAQMSRSRREIPEAVTWVEADATPLWELRRDLNAAQAGSAGGVKVSPLAIILRMVVAGLRRFPTLNASLDTAAGEMVLHDGVNLGVAAQTDRGLVVPVIHDAHTMSILDLARALNDRAETARAGRLQPADMAGGTFTVSNYGAFGVDGGDMVINHPEAAILGTGRIVDKPWVVDGKVVVRKVITYSIAFDHRIIDGGEGAGFIRFLADMTEHPALLTAAL